MLYTPPSQFQFEYDDTTAGTANITTMTQGVLLPASGSSNTKGAWEELVASADRDWYGFWLTFWGTTNNPSAVNAAALCDIGIGGAGSEQVLIGDLVKGNLSTLSTAAFGFLPAPAIYFPLQLAKGGRLSARVQTETSGRTLRCKVWGESGASVPKSVFSGCDTYGANSSSASVGTSLSSNASANTFGSWTNVGGTTTRDYKGFCVSHQAQNATVLNNRVYIIEFGYGGMALSWCMAASGTNETWATAFEAQAVIQNIPAGTQLQARVSCGTASNTETPSVAIHCFY